MPICNDCSKRPRCKTYKESLNDPSKVLFGCEPKVDSKRANYEKHREYDKANTIGVYFIKRLIRQEIAKSEEG